MNSRLDTPAYRNAREAMKTCRIIARGFRHLATEEAVARSAGGSKVTAAIVDAELPINLLTTDRPLFDLVDALRAELGPVTVKGQECFGGPSVALGATSEAAMQWLTMLPRDAWPEFLEFLADVLEVGMAVERERMLRSGAVDDTAGARNRSGSNVGKHSPLTQDERDEIGRRVYEVLPGLLKRNPTRPDDAKGAAYSAAYEWGVRTYGDRMPKRTHSCPAGYYRAYLKRNGLTDPAP